jgi:tetratricopeptide (TPR) repeat protein
MQEKPLVKVTTSSLEALKLFSLGVDQHNLLDFEAARDFYEGALRIDTGFTAAKASLGNINIRAFDPVKGREYLSQAVKSVDNLTDREKLLILAVHAGYVENNIPKTIEYFRMLVQLYPDDAIAHNNMGFTYQRSGEFEKAVKEYKEAIRIDPHAVIAYGGLLWVYLDYLGEADSALVWSLKMISDNPQNTWGYMNLGSAWLCLDSLSKAEEAYLKACEINPGFILNLYRLAHVYRLQKKYDKAISILKHIPEIDQNEASAYYDLGVNYQSMGNQEEAHKYFLTYKKAMTEECIKLRPDNAESFISLAEVLAQLGEMDSSQQTLQKAINIDNTQYLKFAEVLCLQGKVMEAIGELEKAFESGYRDLFWLKLSPDLQILQYDTRFQDLLDKYFPK